jgi:hypothetical protein
VERGIVEEGWTHLHLTRYNSGEVYQLPFQQVFRGGLDPLPPNQVQQWRGVPFTISAGIVEEGWTHYHLTMYNMERCTVSRLCSINIFGSLKHSGRV